LSEIKSLLVEVTQRFSIDDKEVKEKEKINEELKSIINKYLIVK